VRDAFVGRKGLINEEKFVDPETCVWRRTSTIEDS